MPHKPVNAPLRIFLYQAIHKAQRNPQHRVWLHDLQATSRTASQMALSWMQWHDGKRFFHGSIEADGLAYTLKPEYWSTPSNEIYSLLSEIYGLS